MSQLTLKERIELFKLNKKSRKQIRLRFDTLTMDLNLPLASGSLHIPSKHFRVNIKKKKINNLSYNSTKKQFYKTENSEKVEDDILKMKN